MDGTPSRRANPSVITASELVEAHWAEVEPGLIRMLRRRGVSAADAQDIAQETAYRAVSRNELFEGVEGLRRWSAVVAWRLTIQMARRRRRLGWEPVPDKTSPVDVGRVVEGRLALERVVSAMGGLRPRDRSVIAESAAGPATPTSRKEAVRLGVERHRARQRLLALCEGAAAVLVGLWRRFGRLKPIPRVAVAGAPLCVALALSIALGSGSTPSADRGGHGMGGSDAAHARPAPTTATGRDRLATGASGGQGSVLARSAAASARVVPPPSAGDPHAVPALAAPLPGVGGNGEVRARPKEAGDHFVCADTLSVSGWQCVDPPPPPVPMPPLP
ncbi:MAG: hypothetical protein QOG64_40 [Acidimicrobiaceae bacterium]|nr:hypothetical protein [Acidimicrobiaceae bacterium]